MVFVFSRFRDGSVRGCEVRLIADRQRYLQPEPLAASAQNCAAIFNRPSLSRYFFFSVDRIEFHQGGLERALPGKCNAREGLSLTLRPPAFTFAKEAVGSGRAPRILFVGLHRHVFHGLQKTVGPAPGFFDFIAA